MSTQKRIGEYLIKVEQEENPESPRSWDNLGTMICFHNRYTLGDKHKYNSNDYSGWREMEKAIIKNEDVCVILPLYLYDHSGITISINPFSCKWDSGQIGFIYISKKKVREEYSIKRITKEWIEKVTKYLEGEVETYDQYLTGDVYRYDIVKIVKSESGEEDEEDMDSCGGFYGEEECMSEAEGIVNSYLEKHINDIRLELLKNPSQYYSESKSRISRTR